MTDKIEPFNLRDDDIYEAIGFILRDQGSDVNAMRPLTNKIADRVQADLTLDPNGPLPLGQVFFHLVQEKHDDLTQEKWEEKWDPILKGESDDTAGLYDDKLEKKLQELLEKKSRIRNTILASKQIPPTSIQVRNTNLKDKDISRGLTAMNWIRHQMMLRDMKLRDMMEGENPNRVIITPANPYETIPDKFDNDIFEDPDDDTEDLDDDTKDPDDNDQPKKPGGYKPT